jgi:hypothetical protein
MQRRPRGRRQEDRLCYFTGMSPPVKRRFNRVLVQFAFPPGVILSVAVFQTKRRISRLTGIERQPNCTAAFSCWERTGSQVPETYPSFAVIEILAFSTFDTGQPFSAASAYF